jgi:hypothetical protein
MAIKEIVRPARVVAMGTVVAAGLLVAAPSAGAADSSVTRESGHAFSCQGASGGLSVNVELYENSAYGPHASIFVESPDGEFGGGWGPGDVPIVDGRRLSASIPFSSLGEEEVPAGTATVRGTFHNAGPRTKVHEVIEDAGEIITTDGYNRPLSARMTVDVLGRSVRLTCSTAFAFDLRVTRTPAV